MSHQEIVDSIEVRVAETNYTFDNIAARVLNVIDGNSSLHLF